MAKVVFLWHMHQPYYKDALHNKYLMPWVRLHALKGYYDIPLSIQKYGVKGVINLVPSLIEQIRDYVENNAVDIWLEHTIPNPKEMREDEKAFVIKNFFMINWERLVKTSPRYHEILNKRIRYEKKLNWNEMVRIFSDDEIFDLQVLFNLKWFGFMAREKYPRLRELDQKDRNFSQKDKDDLLRVQTSILKEIIPLYKDLAAKGIIEISFTPFYHPIFPLVCDTRIASRSSSLPLPERFSFPEDAKWQLAEGKRYSEETWGNKIIGMWPAEGSVSPEILEPAIGEGVKWLATDESILMNSLGNNDKVSVIYRPYRLKLAEERELFCFARDKYLSDLLGFSFSRMEAKHAVDVFINYVKSINFNLPQGGPEPIVSVILDGENAWESYPNNGEFFLAELFTRLSENSEIKTTTYAEITKQPDCASAAVIPRLFSGSWINGNYDIWIGNDEDNRAWEYLKKVRDFYSKYRENHVVEPQINAEIMRSFYRAEGSDWFWWYGPQFSTENDWLFDRLFRRHLRRVYDLLKIKYPTFLDIPISSTTNETISIHPSALIHPAISGRNESYYEWAGGGVFENLRKAGGAMYNSIKLIDRIVYGFNSSTLFFKIQLVDPLSFYEHKKYFLKGFLVNNRDLNFVLPMVRIDSTEFLVHSSKESGYLSEIVGAGVAAFDEVLEFKLYSKKIGLEAGKKLKIYFKIASNEGIELERVPTNGAIDVIVPDDATLFTLWDV